MNYYFDNVLKGFKAEESKTKLGEYTRIEPQFLLMDVDQDDMPEIVFAFRNDREKYIGVLKRQNMLWRVHNVSSERIGNQNGIFTLLNICDEVCITPRDVGKIMSLKEICPQEDNYFIGFIDGKVYYGEVVPVEEAEEKKNPKIEGDMQVIDFITSDIDGSGCMHHISLMGEKAFGDNTGLTKNMKLKVEEATGVERFSIPLPTTSGYGARVFVGDFTGDGMDEVLVTIYSGPSGGYTYNYLYRISTDRPKLLFDSRIYNESYEGLVHFTDGYKVIVQTEEMGKKYSLDISQKDKDYLAMLYDECGKLKRPVEGQVLGIIAVNPEDFNNDGIYTLSTIQQIAGVHGKDMLGLLETYFKWDEGMSKFRPFREYVSLIGEDM